MLQTDPKKLRYMGIDMHARWRRRVLVVCSYTLFGAAIILRLLQADVQRSLLFQSWLLILTVAFWVFGPFRDGRLLKRFSDTAFWRVRGMPGRFVMLGSLDDRAKYKYGDVFDALPDEQQQELLRTYRVGNYLFPASPNRSPELLDERERVYRDVISTKVLRGVSWMLGIYAGRYAAYHKQIDSVEVMALLLTMGTLAETGVAAYLLWTEEDPRSHRELALL